MGKEDDGKSPDRYIINSIIYARASYKHIDKCLTLLKREESNRW